MRSDWLKQCHDVKLFEIEKMETSCFGLFLYMVKHLFNTFEEYYLQDRDSSQ